MRLLKSSPVIVTGSSSLLVGLSFFTCIVRTASPARAQTDDAQSELTKGMDLLRRRRYEDALKSFNQANEMRGHTCAECFYGMAQAYEGLGAFKNVSESCDKIIELAPADKHLQAAAYNLKGMALEVLAEGKDQKKLQDAESVLRQGLALNTDMASLHYNLGFVLLQQNRDAEGVVELKKYLDLKPNGDDAEEARKMIANPRRSREAFAPDFSFTTAAGEYISNDELRGKVVLLDFWGTWCPPCRESVPSLRDLNKKYAKEKAFVMISVSVNDEEDKWKDFTSKNQMVWPQAFDRDNKIRRAFQVTHFPTYILIDHEGIVRFRVSGFGFNREATLADAIHKAIKTISKNAPSDN
jgi:thiol-disulfide isomerase/thioredoxin